MKTYRYTTTISDKGIIQIPPKAGLYNMEVEIVITPKTLKAKSEMKAEEFVKKWAGFLDTIDTDRSKLEYLTEKYK